jgi:hypothetical protein
MWQLRPLVWDGFPGIAILYSGYRHNTWRPKHPCALQPSDPPAWWQVRHAATEFQGSDHRTDVTIEASNRRKEKRLIDAQMGN